MTHPSARSKTIRCRHSLRVLAALIALSLSVMHPSTARAQAFPGKPITVIWPFPPGNPAENKLRAMYAEAAKTLGQPVVTDYRPGGGGRLGIAAVNKAPPDGYLLSFVVDPVMTVMPHASPSFKLQVDKDYLAVHQPYGVSLIVTAHPSLPFKDARGWIDYAKANPGKLTYATQGIGGGQHLNMEQTMAALGIQMTHVPYGATQMMPDVLSGTVNLTAFGVITLKSHIDAGKLNALATAGPARSPQLPNVPALKEMGYDISVQSWTAIVAPPGTPADVVNKLNAAFNAAQKTPDVAKMLAGDDSYVSLASPAAITAQIKREYERMGPLVQRLGLKFD
jgi:tripartite-type tricarboxylate transporter receptor subunit TctC